MLAALLTTALSAPLCGTPDAIGALSGDAAPTDRHMLEPPADLQIGRPPDVPSPPDGKPIYGTPYEGHEVSENFLVTWAEGAMDPDDVDQTLTHLEDAWLALVEEQQWPAPVSSDAYKLWVIFDPDIPATGYTTLYFSTDYPQGYPVIYLNPSYTYDTRFWRSLSQHEFAHALQYRLRDYAGDAWESWYWEASAQWQAELADPDNDGHLYTSAWYADRPGDRYDSLTDSHQYGMFVLNAYLEEQVTGPDGLRQVWILADDRPGTPWDEILAEGTGQAARDLWAGFTAAYGNGGLAQSDDYAEALRQGTLGEGVGGSLAYLGTDYWAVSADTTVTLQTEEPDSAILAAPGGTGTRLDVRAGEVLAVTGTLDPGEAAYTLTFEDGSGDTGDSTPDGDTGDSADSDRPEPSDDGGAKTGRAGCMTSPTPGLLGLLVVPLLLGRRRQDRGV